MVCLGLIALASPALAHRVLVFAFAQGDTIHTESNFVGSGAVQKGEVQVQDKDTGKVLVTGTTDEQGKFAFKIPPEAVSQRLDLLIIVGASWAIRANGCSKPTVIFLKPQKRPPLLLTPPAAWPSPIRAPVTSRPQGRRPLTSKPWKRP